MDQAIILPCWDTLIPVLTKVSNRHNNYRPVELTSVVMTCFERLVSKHIKAGIPPTLNHVSAIGSVQTFGYYYSRDLSQQTVCHWPPTFHLWIEKILFNKLLNLATTSPTPWRPVPALHNGVWGVHWRFFVTSFTVLSWATPKNKTNSLRRRAKPRQSCL